jgi:Rrf2 family protein
LKGTWTENALPPASRVPDLITEGQTWQLATGRQLEDGPVKLQVSTRLAIFAVLELTAHEGHHASVAEIGQKFGVSTHHLAKVMHVMARAGLVRSTRGAGGGYTFAGNARRTTLLDVIQLFEEAKLGEAGTIDASSAADATSEGRALRDVLKEIDEIAYATLGSITIATMRKLVDRRRKSRA